MIESEWLKVGEFEEVDEVIVGGNNENIEAIYEIWGSRFHFCV